MSVVVDGERIVVEPEDVDVNDFIEYAELAIQRYGWRQGERKQVTEEDMVKVAEKEGLSLHDAIGYTNVMLGGDKTGEPTSKNAGTRTVRGDRAMRSEMTRAIKAVLPEGKDDRAFNDEAKSVDEVLAVLREARGVTA
jgi:hypothetical protein